MRKESHTYLGPMVAGLLFAVSLAACGSQPAPKVHTVTIDSTSYAPTVLEVSVGDTIVWTNDDILVHTVTAKDGTFDSKDIAPGESWRYEVSTAGDLDYECVYHPTMQGLLRVR